MKTIKKCFKLPASASLRQLEAAHDDLCDGAEDLAKVTLGYLIALVSPAELKRGVSLLREQAESQQTEPGEAESP